MEYLARAQRPGDHAGPGSPAPERERGLAAAPPFSSRRHEPMLSLVCYGGHPTSAERAPDRGRGLAIRPVAHRPARTATGCCPARRGTRTPFKVTTSESLRGSGKGLGGLGRSRGAPVAVLTAAWR